MVITIHTRTFLNLERHCVGELQPDSHLTAPLQNATLRRNMHSCLCSLLRNILSCSCVYILAKTVERLLYLPVVTINPSFYLDRLDWVVWAV